MPPRLPAGALRSPTPLPPLPAGGHCAPQDSCRCGCLRELLARPAIAACGSSPWPPSLRRHVTFMAVRTLTKCNCPVFLEQLPATLATAKFSVTTSRRSLSLPGHIPNAHQVGPCRAMDPESHRGPQRAAPSQSGGRAFGARGPQPSTALEAWMHRGCTKGVMKLPVLFTVPFLIIPTILFGC